MDLIEDYLKTYDPETFYQYKYDLVLKEFRKKIEEQNIRYIIYRNTGSIINYINPNIFNKILFYL
jgi:hypothetical protein